MITKRQKFEKDMTALLKKHKLLLRGFVEFPNGKVPMLGRLAARLLDWCGAKIQIRAVPRIPVI